MKKIILIFLFLNPFLYALSNNSYTIILHKEFNINKAKQYAKKVKNPKKKVFIVKGKFSYFIAYGEFNSLEEADTYLDIYRKSLYSNNPRVYELHIPSRYRPKAKIYNTYKKETSKLSINLITSQESLSGNLKFGSSGTKVDLKEHLGLDEAVTTFIPEITYKNGAHIFYANYLSSSHKGSTLINKNIIAHDYTYNQGTLLSSTIQSNIFNTGYKYNILETNIGIAFTNYNKELSFKDSSNTTSINLDYNLYKLSLDKQHHINNYVLNYGLKFGQGNNISFQNYFLSIGIKDIFIKNGSINFGYNSSKYEIDENIYQDKSNYNSIYIAFKKEF